MTGNSFGDEAGDRVALPHKTFVMKKRVSSIFAFFCKVSVCILIGLLWAPVIVPILFYFTFADGDMKAQLLWDWVEFFDLVNSAKSNQSRGIPLTLPYKAVLIAKKISDIGFLWIPIGLLWGFSSRLPSALRWGRLQVSKDMPGRK